MIGNANIHVLDIDTETNMHKTIQDIFWNYAHRITQVDDNLSYIDLSGSNVKIKDWTGWTQLLKIERILVSRSNILKLGTDDAYNLNILDENIPVYENTTSIRGFHGEVKYKYRIHQYQYLKNQEKVLMRMIFPGEEKWQDFINIEVINSYIEEGVPFYRIYTKSGFYNANGFHLCSADTKIEADKELFK